MENDLIYYSPFQVCFHGIIIYVLASVMYTSPQKKNEVLQNVCEMYNGVKVQWPNKACTLPEYIA